MPLKYDVHMERPMAEHVPLHDEAMYLDETTRERFYSAMRAEPIPSTELRRLMSEDDPRFELTD
jgi:hypothetical protein